MKFRIVWTVNLKNEKTFRTEWLDCSKYTIKNMRKIEKKFNEDKVIKDWYLEYNRN